MPKSLTISVRSRDLSSFRRKALYHARRNKEYLEVIFLERKNDFYIIREFHKVTILKANIDTVEYDAAELKKLAKTKGLLFGTLHTHVQCKAFKVDHSPSTDDYICATDDGEHIFGICAINITKSGRYQTKISFWFPQLLSTIIQK